MRIRAPEQRHLAARPATTKRKICPSLLFTPVQILLSYQRPVLVEIAVSLPHRILPLLLCIIPSPLGVYGNFEGTQFPFNGEPCDISLLVICIWLQESQ